ncbi:hypothetical protein EKI60_05780 [Candidatus Saccharibacteria bacterium]|nr:MAG: hypothetical protein EKI60_05780 [Candidatus Saccharibacteria bacterium]
MTTIMCTGHRKLNHPEAIYECLLNYLGANRFDQAISGGAGGADSIFAEAALETDTPLKVIFPNQYYTSYYPESFMAEPSSVEFAVERRMSDDWRSLWQTERWWTDNLTRNRVMIARSDVTLVISTINPLDLLNYKKGGTSSCLKDIRSMDPEREIVWVNDDPNPMVTRVHFSNPVQLRLLCND